MTRIISVSTNKGGVLKTSIATNLAGVLCKKGKVLVIDVDNQGDVALSFGLTPDDFEHTIYDVLVDDMPAKHVVENVYKNIDILPGNDDMEFFDIDVLTNINRYKQPFSLLRSKLKDIENNYDYVIVDTPPNIGLAQGNSLAYVDEVLIPFQPENYSMRSLVKIINAVQSFKKDHNPKLRILGIVATLVDSRTTLHSEILQECRKYCFENNLKVFDTIIPRTIRYASSVAYEGLPATLTEKNMNFIQPYIDLEREICNE